MNFWKRIAARFAGGEEPTQRPDVGMTYADLERKRDFKERQLSGVFPREARLPRRAPSPDPEPWRER